MIIVGLGNPDARYAATRHNVGRDAVVRLAEQHGLSFPRRKRFRAHITEGRIGDRNCILALPETYMNRSGDSVGPLMGYYKRAPEDVLVVHDDMGLDCGLVRLKQGGGHGGHNGLRDLQRGLGSREYGRIRIGIGRPPARMDPANFVLSRFTQEERALIDEAVERAVDAIRDTAANGLEVAMNEFNRRTKNKESA